MDEDTIDFDNPRTAAQQLLDELRSLAFTDIGEAYGDNNVLLDIKNMPISIRRAIASVETEELYQKFGGQQELMGYTRKIKLWDKRHAIETFMKHLGMFIERLEVKQDININVNHVDLDERIDIITKNRTN